MFYIITRANHDGTYDEVGMANRIPHNGTPRAARKIAEFWWHQGFSVRVQEFQDKYCQTPRSTYFL